MQYVSLGCIPFEQALELQNETVEAISRGEKGETVYLLEHPHVFTLGRRGDEANLLAGADWEGNSIRAIRINRGGDITYHGPGQLVVYPHLDLRVRGRDLHRYLRNLEQAIIEFAAMYGIPVFRRNSLTGVWTAQGKLASIGVGVRHWITMHGLALNLTTDLRYFDLINPCGLQDCRVTSLEELRGKSVDREKAADRFRSCFDTVFRD